MRTAVVVKLFSLLRIPNSAIRTPHFAFKLLVLLMGPDTTGRDGFVYDLLSEVAGQRIVMRELHMIRTAGLSHRVEF